MRRGADAVQVRGPRGRPRRGDAAGDAQATGPAAAAAAAAAAVSLRGAGPAGAGALGGARPGIPACDAPGACGRLRLRGPTQLLPGRPRAGVG